MTVERAATPTIVVVGSMNTDLIAYAARLPDAGETVIGRDFQSGFGGKGGNQAVMAARLGASVAMVGAVGDDDYGTSYLTNLAREGVATDHVARVPGPSGVAPIWVDDAGSNRIVVVPGANDHVPIDDAVDAVEARRPTVVVGQHEIPQAVTAAAFIAARRVGAVTMLNPAPAAPIPPDLLAVVDWLVPNETEFALLSGVSVTGDDAHDDAAVANFGGGAGVSVAVTVGARGVVLAPLGGPVVRVPPPRVTAIDSSGAGDAFVGAFSVGLGLGWTPEAAARLGCAAAADSVTRRGTQRSFLDRDAAAALLAAVATGGSA